MAGQQREFNLVTLLRRQWRPLSSLLRSDVQWENMKFLAALTGATTFPNSQ